MSKKRNFKKGFALLTVLTMVVGISVNVSAATHNTQTTYTMGQSKVSVTSTITGVQTGEQVTYLAYNSEIGGGTISKDNIVYIDQQLAPATTVVFDYDTEISKLGTTLVKFGASITPAASITVEGTNQINTYLIDVTSSAGGSVTPADPSVLTDGYRFTITPDPSKKIASILFNDVAANLDGVIAGTPYVYEVTNVTVDSTLVVTFDDRFPVAQNYVTEGKQFGTPVLNDVGANITTYSSITVTPDVETAGYEYGVLFSYSVDPKFADQAIDWSGSVAGSLSQATQLGAIKYKAFGKGLDGKYAVKLEDGGSGYLNVAGATYYTTPYLVINGDYANATYGASIPFGVQ